MRNICLGLIFLLVACVAQAQQYTPFPKSGGAWLQHYFNHTTQPISGYAYLIEQEKDTVINNLTYSLLYKTSQSAYNTPKGWVISHYRSEYGALREDSFKHIYFFDLHDKKEYLIYDFNLQVGDTIPLGYNHKNENYPIVISNIDSILIDTVYRKRFGLSDMSSNYTEPYAYIIEGIGSKYGLLSDLKWPFEIGNHLDCFGIDGKSLFPYPNGKCALSKPTSVPENPLTFFNLFPNPTTGRFTIQTQSIFSNGYICVRDVTGRIMHQENLQFPSQQIDISKNPKGLYFVEISNGNNKTVQKLLMH